jgi:hypothetical protein
VHATYDSDQVGSYVAAATHAADVLTDFRAPFRGRATPVTAWWGTFDLAVNPNIAVVQPSVTESLSSRFQTLESVLWPP